MDFSKIAYVAILFTLYVSTAHGYNSKNNGLGFFPNLLSSQIVKQQPFSSYVYPNHVPVPSYVRPVQQPIIHAAVPAPSYVVPAPKGLYSALLPAGLSRFGKYPVHAGHSAYKPFYSHQETVTKSVIYSVLLSEILRRFQ